MGSSEKLLPKKKLSQKHAVLGVVLERPAYGYQIAQRLEDRCSAWDWSGSGVYGALNSLEREGFVVPLGGKPLRDDSGRGPRRLIYEGTDEGRRSFSEWMSEYPEMAPMRDELSLKLLFATPETVPALIKQCEDQEVVCLGQIADLKKDEDPPSSALGFGRVGALLVRNRELKELQGRIDWLQEVRAELDGEGAPAQRP